MSKKNSEKNRDIDYICPNMGVEELVKQVRTMSDADFELLLEKMQIVKLLSKVDCYETNRFFDIDSDKMLDEKIEVLTALKNGKTISEIPKFYDVLEKYPKNKM